MVNRMETVAAKLPKSLVDAVDGIVAAGGFPNRSEVVRVAVREFLEARGRVSPEGKAVRPHSARTRSYVQRLKELAKDPRYRNRFVALHQGEVLDADDDLHTLVLRALKRPEQPIYIERVTETGEPRTLRGPGIRVRSR